MITPRNTVRISRFNWWCRCSKIKTWMRSSKQQRNISHRRRQLPQCSSSLYIVTLITGEVTKRFWGKVWNGITNWFSVNRQRALSTRKGTSRPGARSLRKPRTAIGGQGKQELTSERRLKYKRQHPTLQKKAPRESKTFVLHTTKKADQRTGRWLERQARKTTFHQNVE